MFIKDSLKVILPKLNDDVLDSIEAELLSKGVEEPEDLNLVEGEYLRGLLNEIQIKKVLAAWQTAGRVIKMNYVNNELLMISFHSNH